MKSIKKKRSLYEKRTVKTYFKQLSVSINSANLVHLNIRSCQPQETRPLDMFFMLSQDQFAFMYKRCRIPCRVGCHRWLFTVHSFVAGSPLSVAMNGSSSSSLDSSAARAKAADVMPLPAWARAYVYGIQGFVYEVVFTALFDFLFEPSGNPTLRGCSTVASFFIYGLCGMLCEQAIFLYCRR